MRTAAIKLTVDAAGKHPGDAGFDPQTITRWGWNGGVTYYWQDAPIEALGGELCANADCTTMSFTEPGDPQGVRVVGRPRQATTTPGWTTRTAGRRRASPATRSCRARRRWARTGRSPSASSTPPAPSTTTSSRRSSEPTASGTPR